MTGRFVGARAWGRIRLSQSVGATKAVRYLCECTVSLPFSLRHRRQRTASTRGRHHRRYRGPLTTFRATSRGGKGELKSPTTRKREGDQEMWWRADRVSTLIPPTNVYIYCMERGLFVGLEALPSHPCHYPTRSVVIPAQESCTSISERHQT